MNFERWLSNLADGLKSDGGRAESAQAGDHAADRDRLTAVLLIEIARADHTIDQPERQAIREALAGASTLSASELDELIDAALREAEGTVSLHAHVKQLNDALDKAAKVSLIEQMWRVALADGDIDRYEEHMIRKLSDLLYLKHRDFMQAKLRILEAG